MLKRILLTLCLVCLLSTSAWATDYWVYIQTHTNSGLTLDDDKGRGKDWDIIDVLPVTPQFVPSEKEKQEYLIFRVNNANLDKEILAGVWEEIDTRTVRKQYWKSEWENPAKGPQIRSKDRVKGFNIARTKVNQVRSNGLPNDDLLEIDIQEEYEKPIANRRKKFDYAKFTTLKKGLVPGALNQGQFLANVKDRTQADLIAFNLAWVKNLPQNLIAFADQRLNTNFSGNAYAAASTNTINWASEDYNTTQLWENAVDGVLDGIQTGHLYNDDGDLDEKLLINGSTTTATDYIYLTSPVGERHNGTDDGSATMTTTSRGAIIDIADNFTQISYLILFYNVSSGCCRETVEINNNDTEVWANVVHGRLESAGDVPQGTEGIAVESGPTDGGLSVLIYSNIIYDYDCAANDCDGITGDGGDDSAIVLNNTAVDVDDGFTTGFNDTEWWNNLCSDSNAGQSTCYSNDSTAGGYNYTDTTENLNYISCGSECGTGDIKSNDSGWDDVTYIDAANDDFHLTVKAGEDVGPWSNGTDKTGDITNDVDIDGEPFDTSDVDIGADQHTALATFVPKVIISDNGIPAIRQYALAVQKRSRERLKLEKRREREEKWNRFWEWLKPY